MSTHRPVELPVIEVQNLSSVPVHASLLDQLAQPPILVKIRNGVLSYEDLIRLLPITRIVIKKIRIEEVVFVEAETKILEMKPKLSSRSIDGGLYSLEPLLSIKAYNQQVQKEIVDYNIGYATNGITNLTVYMTPKAVIKIYISGYLLQ